MWRKLFGIKEKDVQPAVIEQTTFTTDRRTKSALDRLEELENAHGRTFQKTPNVLPKNAMDDAGQPIPTKLMYKFNALTIPYAQFMWYSGQGFIGYQMCAMLSQHWIIRKACAMPAKDAVRKGYDVTVNNGVEISSEILDALRKYDEEFKINDHMVNFVQKGRIYGIRVAKFLVDSTEKDYYMKPFNLDGVAPGSYRGIVQIDPQWCTPILSGDNATQPGSPNFYEPLYWLINGVQHHRSHLIIFRTEEVVDILKPTYMYGGVSIPQKVYERVYAAERTANEAPMLAASKRTKIIQVDMAAAIADEVDFTQKMETYANEANNFGYQIIDKAETMNQFDTSLADFDAVIMTQYQLIAAIVNVPAVKLLGTTPKGFNATGEYEEASYHEELETIQTHDLTPLLNRHHALVIRSYIAPKFGIAPFDTSVNFAPLDALTENELANINKTKADTAAVLANIGAIDGADERERIINDPNSGYTGISKDVPEPDFHDENTNEGQEGLGEES